MKRILFICSQNRLRSPTAEAVFADYRGIEVASAGIGTDAVVPVTPELLTWAELVFVMERSHRNKLTKKFRSSLRGQRVICLEIPDEYDYMQPELVELLKQRVTRSLTSIS